MLLDGGDLGVDCLDSGAGNAGETDFASVAFQGSVDEGRCHTIDVAGGFGVGESLVGGSLLQAVCLGQ